MKSLCQWVREKMGVTALERENKFMRDELASQARRIADRIAELDDLTRMDADVGFRGDCTIILTGVYRGRGYVQFYDVPHEQFRDYVERLQYGKKNNLIRHVDAPMGFKAAFDLS